MDASQKYILKHQAFIVEALGGDIETMMFNQSIANSASPENAISIEDAREIVQGYAAPHLVKMCAVFGNTYYKKEKKDVLAVAMCSVGIPYNFNTEQSIVDYSSLSKEDHVGVGIALGDEFFLSALCSNNKVYTVEEKNVEKLMIGSSSNCAISPLPNNKKVGKKLSRFLYEGESTEEVNVYYHALLKDRMILMNTEGMEFLVCYPLLKFEKNSKLIYESCISVHGKVGRSILVKIVQENKC